MATDLQYRLIDAVVSRAIPGAPVGVAKAVADIKTLVTANAPIVDITNVALMLLEDGGSGFFDPSRLREYLKPLQKEFDQQVSMLARVGVVVERALGLPGYVRKWWPFDHALFVMNNSFNGTATLAGVYRGDVSDFVFLMYRSGRLEVLDNSTASMTRGDVAEPHFNTAALVAQALCMAKNASLVEASADRATRKRYPSAAGIRFSHIDIDMGKPKRADQTRSDDPQHGVAWHHRRGHWAYYRPEAPLFGRPGAHGWYWRPYTEVGDKAHGEVVQDYTIKATLPTGGGCHD